MKPNDFLLTSMEANEILRLPEGGQAELSLDLGLSTTSVRVFDGSLILPNGGRVARSDLETIARKPKRVFRVSGGEVRPLEIAGDHYYKLTPTSAAPTIEIDGVQMHRTKGMDPFEDSRLKVVDTVRSGDRTLDTCGGLGYTAIWAIRCGADSVVSVEVCGEVRDLRAHNPWSRDLCDDRIELVEGDVFEYVSLQPDASFHSAVHDPPRFSLAGELYSGRFYEELARVLRSGGRLFHYTGTPFSRRGRRSFPDEVVGRLRAAGFEGAYDPEKLGILAVR